MQTPETIQTMIAQLGGRQIFAMAFEGSVYEGAQKLTLRVARSLVKAARGKATHVDVTLEASDTYTVRVYRIGTARTHYALAEIETISFVYGDQLRAVVAKSIGLDLTLGNMRGAA